MSGAVACEPVAADVPALRTGWGLPLARGAYCRPSARSPRIAIIAAHYNLDFSHHYLAPLLAARGFGFLGWNTRFCGREAYFLLDRALVDIGLGVRWLRDHGAEVVVLLGNSGGGSLMAAYQAQAHAPVVRAARGARLAAGIDRLPPGDLYVSLAAHPGRPEVLTSWLDPSVLDERDPALTEPSLDMYDACNGPPFPEDFVERYRAAQRARNQRVTEWCRRELERMQNAGFPDRLFTLQRTWADLRFLDPALDPNERSVPACYLGDPARANRGIDGIATVSSLRTWLAMWSLEESQCRSADYLPQLRTPSLVVQAGADCGVFPSDAQAILAGLGSHDKQLVQVAGDHYFQTPATARQELAELIAGWIAERTGRAPA